MRLGRVILLAMGVLALGACGAHPVTYKIRRQGAIIELKVEKNDLGGVVGYWLGSTYKEVTLQPIYEFLEPGDQILSRTSGRSFPGLQPRALSSAEISRSTTLLGIGENGRLLEFETTNFTVTRSLNTGENLRSGATSPDNSRLYLSSTGPELTIRGSVKVVNLETFTVTGTISLPADALPNSLAVTPDGAYLFIAAAVNGPLDETRLYIADTSRNTIVKTLVFPGSEGARWLSDLKISRDGGLAFFAVRGGIAVIDVLTREVSHTLPESGASGLRVEVDPAGVSLYVAPAFGDRFATGIAVYDVATATRVKHIPVSDLSGPMAMKLGPDGRSVAIEYVSGGAVVFKWIDVDTLLPIAERSFTDANRTVGRLVAVPAR